MKVFMGFFKYIKILLTPSISIYHAHNILSFSFSQVAFNKPSNIFSAKQKPIPLTDNEQLEGCRLGLDTHADISCAGKHARVN